MTDAPAISVLLAALVLLWLRPMWGVVLLAFITFQRPMNTTPPGAVAPEADAALRTRVEPALPSRESGFWGYVLVANEGREVVSKGYGPERRREAGGPEISGKSLFDIGSISKPLTATAVMVLAEQGKLTLDDPVEQYDPGARGGVKPSGITLRHILSHTSGRPHAIRPYDEPDMARAFSEFLGAGPTAKPGERFQYNNGGYCVLAGVVEQASGVPFDEFMRDRVFRPMGMLCTGLPSQRAALDAEHATQRGPQPGVTALDHPWGWGARGCTGVITCGDDLLAWDRAIRAGALLTPASLANMHARVIPADGPAGGAYGLGWFVTDVEGGVVRLAHSGGCFGYRSELRRYPDRGLLIVVLTSDQHDPRRIADAIEKAALRGP